MNKVRDLLSWLRIQDVDGLLSLTNLGVIVVLAKIAVSPNTSITELGALMVTLIGYNYKKRLHKTSKEPLVSDKTLQELSDKVSALSLQAGIKNPLKTK